MNETIYAVAACFLYIISDLIVKFFNCDCSITFRVSILVSGVLLSILVYGVWLFLLKEKTESNTLKEYYSCYKGGYWGYSKPNPEYWENRGPCECVFDHFTELLKIAGILIIPSLIFSAFEYYREFGAGGDSRGIFQITTFSLFAVSFVTSSFVLIYWHIKESAIIQSSFEEERYIKRLKDTMKS